MRIARGQPKILERPLEDGEGVQLLRRRERFAGQQIAAGEVGDGQRIAVAPVGEHELALVVGTPEVIGLAGLRERGALGAMAPALAPRHQAVPIEDGVDGADRRALHVGTALTQPLADLRRAPARILPLQPHDRLLDRQRELIGVPVRPPAAVGQRLAAPQSL